MKPTYSIRYNHRSPMSATSRAQAVRMVRAEASVPRLARAECTDGLYLWVSQGDMRRDDTGARAFAVISSPAQRNAYR